MNSRQKKVLVAGAALVALMLLFPPWDYFDPDSSGKSRAGYHFFLTPPNPKTAIFSYKVRFPDLIRVRLNKLRLLIQLLITIPTTIGLALLLGSKRSVITIILGILCLGFAAFVIGFIIWIDVSAWLEDGEWNLLP